MGSSSSFVFPVSSLGGRGGGAGAISVVIARAVEGRVLSIFMGRAPGRRERVRGEFNRARCDLYKPS